jgi:hypothetical protein
MALPVALTVKGTGTSTATGTITLSDGSYSSTATPLVNGAASITVPANALPVGSGTLTASYSGDAHYNSAAGNAALTVTGISTSGGTTPGTYTFAVKGVGNDAAATTAMATFSVTIP